MTTSGEPTSGSGGGPRARRLVADDCWELWPEPSPDVRRLIRVIAERLQGEIPELSDELWSAAQQFGQTEVFADDPVMVELDRHVNRVNLTRWAVANIENPGGRVSPVESAESLKYAQDLAGRGLYADDLDAWRAAQRVLWNWWLQQCLAVTAEPDTLRDLIEISSNSITTFMDDSKAIITAYIHEFRSELARGPHVQRLSTVQSLMQGSVRHVDRAEAQLGYALTGHHVAAVLWTDSDDKAAELERAADRIMSASGASHHLVLPAGIATLWAWLPVGAVPDQDAMRTVLRQFPGVQLAFGRAGTGVAGFRRSHVDAIAAQRLLVRLGSHRQVVRFMDVQLAALLAADLVEAEQFVADTLGALADADSELRTTVRVFIAEQFNVARAATRLFVHRNTVDRRLMRADSLLPCPVAQKSTQIDVALAWLELRDGD